MALPQSSPLVFTRDGKEILTDQVLRILDWSGARVEVWCSPFKFRIQNTAIRTERTEVILQYLSWEDQKMIAQFDGSNFATQNSAVPGGVMAVEKTLRYKSWDGSRWTASVASSPIGQPMNSMSSSSKSGLYSGWAPAAGMVAVASSLPGSPYQPQPMPQSNPSTMYSPAPMSSPSYIPAAPMSSSRNMSMIGPYPSSTYPQPPVHSSMSSSQPMSYPPAAPMHSSTYPMGPSSASTVGPVLQSFYRFKHQRQFSNAAHEDVVLHYKSWDDTDWTARLANGNFYVTRGGQPGGHTDSIINYKAWDGSNWTARLTMQDGLPAFHHIKQYSPGGHTDKALQYKTWDGSCWMTTLVPDPSLAPYLQ